MRVRRLFNGLILAAGIAWVGSFAAMIAMARDFVYPFTDGIDASRPAGVPGVRRMQIAAADGTPLTIWLAPPRHERPVILYFMGNAGSLPHSAPRLAEFVHRGFGIAALNYRGAGGQPGTPSQAALTADALLFFDALDELTGSPVPTEHRVVYGTSLGAAVALQVASQREVGAIILESPFNRLCEVAEHHYPIYPACLALPYERWSSADVIQRVQAPVLILHGDADRTIPVAQGRTLFDAAREPKRLIVYPGGRHNDLRLHGAGADAIAFIEALTDD